MQNIDMFRRSNSHRFIEISQLVHRVSPPRNPAHFIHHQPSYPAKFSHHPSIHPSQPLPHGKVRRHIVKIAYPQPQHPTPPQEKKKLKKIQLRDADSGGTTTGHCVTIPRLRPQAVGMVLVRWKSDLGAWGNQWDGGYIRWLGNRWGIDFFCFNLFELSSERGKGRELCGGYCMYVCNM